MSRANLIALDAATGTPAAGFGTVGAVDVGVPYGGTPTIFENVAIIGAASGEVPQGPPGNPRAFDVRSGAKLWEFQTVPRAGEPFNDTWGNGWEGRGGTNMWALCRARRCASAASRISRSRVPPPNYYGGDRPGNNAFANSIVAVDARTGAYRWHFQTVHHDLWDIDMPSAGGLFELERNGSAIAGDRARRQVRYLLRPRSRDGRAAASTVEETTGAAGDVPTEWYSPTQPIPVQPPPLARVSFSEADVVRPKTRRPSTRPRAATSWRAAAASTTPGRSRRSCTRRRDAPPKSTIQFPGGTGGVNWGGVAVDPTTGSCSPRRTTARSSAGCRIRTRT